MTDILGAVPSGRDIQGPKPDQEEYVNKRTKPSTTKPIPPINARLRTLLILIPVSFLRFP
jgi:hypothetical protein